jgi:hypothetical protein
MKYALKTLGHKKTAYTEMLKFIKTNRPSIFFEAPYTLPGILKRHSAKSVNNLIRKIAELPSNSAATFRSAYWADVDKALLKTLYDQPENTQLLDSMVDILHKKSPYVETAGHLEGLTYILPTLLEKDKSAIDLFMTISSEVFNSPGHKMIIKYLNDGLKLAKPNEIKPIIDLVVNVETYEDIKPLEIALEYGSIMYPEMGLDAYHHAMNNLIFSEDNSEILDVVNEYYTIKKRLTTKDLGWIGKLDQEKYQGLVNCAKDCIAKENPHIIRELKKLKGLSSFELLDDKTSNRAASVFDNMYDSHEMYHNNVHNLFIAAAKIIGDKYGSEEQLKFITDANNDNLHNLLDTSTSMWAHKRDID